MLRDMEQSFPWLAGMGLCMLVLLVGRSADLWAQTRRTSGQPTPLQGRETRRDSRAVLPPGRPVPSAGITLENGLLSVNVRGQDLRTIIDNIATQGGIEVRHAEGLPATRVSLRFDGMPLVEGLKRLFRVAELSGYALVTEGQGEQTKVQRILFLAAQEGVGASRPSPRRPARPTSTRNARRVTRPRTPTVKASEEGRSENQSVFEEIKNNTTARRLLSQMVHPNEQVRERALERLIRLVSDDEKQAELLDYLEPLMEQLTSEDKEDRDEARADIRKLLRR